MPDRRARVYRLLGLRQLGNGLEKLRKPTVFAVRDTGLSF
jgi:hypothetical protein